MVRSYKSQNAELKNEMWNRWRRAQIRRKRDESGDGNGKG